MPGLVSGQKPKITLAALALTSLCALASLFSIASQASSRFSFEVWTTDNGLPQNTINSIIQTREGYLWLATADGLVRYDGAQFTIFNMGNSRGLETNRFLSLYEDGEGALWIGTEDGGLARYKDGSFTTFAERDGLPDKSITGLAGDGQGGVLVATTGGLRYLRDGKFISYAGNNGKIDSSLKYVGKSGVLWRKQGRRIELISKGSLITITAPENFNETEVAAAIADHEGAFWIGTTNRGALRWKQGIVSLYSVKDGLPGERIDTIYEDSRGNIWFGVSEKGLVRFSDGRFTTFTKADGLSDTIIISLYEDREGSLWIGTFRNGLNRLRKQVVSVISEREGLAGQNIYPVFEDSEGAVWISTWPSGVSRYKGGRFTHYGTSDGLAGEYVTAIAEDRDGHIWVGSYGGVSRLLNGHFEVLYDSQQLDASVVWVIHQDRLGNQWLGTNNGLIKYSGGQITRYTTRDGLAGDDVKAILEDSRGNLWVGTYGGLSLMTEGGFTNYTKEDGLGSNRVRSINEDEDGTLWIGTYDGGLSRLKSGRITTYTMKEGLFNNGAFQTLDDRRGNLWMSCNLGIYLVSKQQLNDFAEGKIQTLICTSYGKQDGLLNIECNGGAQPAGCRTRDGRLWFPTQEGVAVIDPQDVSFNPQPPPVIIEYCAVDRKVEDLRQSLRVAPGQENIEIHYTGLSFIRSANVHFKYRLEGIDNDWVDAGTRRVAYYTHLPPGQYRFRVIAANADGVWNMEGASLRIIVLPPFWRTWWFAALAVSAIVTLAVFVYRWRVKRLKRAHEAQAAFSRQLIESQESERKRIAAELHDSLGQNLLVIKNWALIGLNSLRGEERVREQLEEISATASQAIDEVRQITYNLRPYQLDEVGLTTALRSMLNRISSSSKIRLRVDIDPIDDLFLTEQAINIYRIVQESVNNIIKHSGATEAEVSIKRDARNIQMMIRDNGKGFSPDGLNGSGRSGFGLTGIAERARMLRGRVDIRSGSGQGTTIIVTLEQADQSKGEQDGR